MSNGAAAEVGSDDASSMGGDTDGGWEYRPLRIPPGISRPAATTHLAIHAEFSGWELSTVRLYADGSRRVWLRRRRQPALAGLPGVIV